MAWQKWHITTNGYIKRFGKNNKGSENYPRAKYKNLSREEMEELVNQLNYVSENKAKEKYVIESSFLSKRILDDFRDYLSGHHKNEYTTTNTYNSFVIHGIKELQKIGPSPREWKQYEKDWGKSLMKKRLASKTIKSIVQTVNRFFEYSSQRNPDLIPNIKLNPLSPNQLRHHELKRVKKIITKGRRDPDGYYIPKKDVNKIFKNPPEDITSHLILSYQYGLRVSETCAIPQDIKLRFKKKTIIIDRQLKYVGDTGDFFGIITTLPKYDIIRETPHEFNDYFTKSDIKTAIKTMKLLHKDTVEKKIAEYTKELSLSIPYYTSHDFRRTFITDCFDNEIDSVKIMDAVGHKKLDTTLRYRRKIDDDDNTLDW